MHKLGMKVGELARRTGVSVRTLHHYHEIGLLVPRQHFPGDHRTYLRDDVARLQRIKSLQALGFSLTEVRGCLERPEGSLLATVERHLALVEKQLEAQQSLQTRLTTIAALLRSSEEAPVEDLVQTIETIVILARHYRPEQLRRMEARQAELGEETIGAAQDLWADLFAQLGEARRAGSSPASDSVLDLARKANALLEQFTGGDADIRDSLANLYREQGGPELLARHGMAVEAGVWEFLGQAQAALRKEGLRKEGL